MKFDLVLLHPPSVYDFREKPLLAGPISDVVPSSSIFEMYPIGLTSMADYLERHGYRVKIINIANRMLLNSNYDVEKKLKKIITKAYGIDLHWLPHAHGSIELAKLVKKLHPDTPIIFGGLSSTYYHKELIQYPFIDFVLKGDSTEKPLLQLMNHIEDAKVSYSSIPNLTWKKNNEYFYNPITHVDKDLDDIDIPGYRYTIRSVFKYRNFLDPLPYNGWIQYPNTALLTARGCNETCLICGGSKSAYRENCNRKQIAIRSPKKLVEDIKFIQRFSRAPIFIIHDIRQGGQSYVDDFLMELKKIKLKNELVFELFQYADEEFFRKIKEVVPKYSIEITIESHDEKLRKLNGKFRDSNEKLVETLNSSLKNNCSKIDLFFMVGIPGQDYESAIKNINFCEIIHKRCNQDNRLSYFIAPLAPFLDPASLAFERPQVFGYIKYCNSLEDHYKALLKPSWKHMLSYETTSMTKNDIVQATYESAGLLNTFKYNHSIIDKKTYLEVDDKINKSLEYIAKIDQILSLPLEDQSAELHKLKQKLIELNRYSICGKNELKWEVKKHYTNFFSLAFVGAELLVKDILFTIKKRLGFVNHC